MKNNGTKHGAPAMGNGMAKLGAIGAGKANPGTVHPIDTMGTGRVVSIGSMAKVVSGRKLSRKGLTQGKGMC